MKAILVIFSLMAISWTSQAYEFNFLVVNAFRSADQVKQKLDVEFEKINQFILRPAGMEAVINSVSKSISHEVKGSVTGNNCTPSTQYFQRINLKAIGFPYNVSRVTLGGIGLIMPFNPVAKEGDIGGDWDTQYLLIPYCTK